MAGATRKAPAVKKKAAPVCKECRSLPYLAAGAEPVEGAEYRPRVDRPAPHPGPRCTSHHRIKRAADRLRAHGNRVVQVYGITGEFYWQLYDFQDGRCFICRRAYGKRKRLAVDHNHETGEVRGLLCTSCNKNVVGHLRDDPDAFRRGAEYLEDPPARRLAALSVA